MWENKHLLESRDATKTMADRNGATTSIWMPREKKIDKEHNTTQITVVSHDYVLDNSAKEDIDKTFKSIKVDIGKKVSHFYVCNEKLDRMKAAIIEAEK